MLHACTYFDANFLSRGIALHRSLMRFTEDFHLCVLCLDDASFALMQKIQLPHVTAVPLTAMEDHCPELKEMKTNRTIFEYYASSKPFLLRYLFEREPAIEKLVYIDADMYFFASPKLVFDELGEHCALITPHRFARNQEDWSRYGTYNSGLVAFRRSDSGMECLSWWCERVREWCKDHVEGERFADQGYLNEFPHRWPCVNATKHPGMNVAPWNIETHQFSEKHGQVLVDGKPLVFYHFHGLRSLGSGIYDTGVARYRTPLPKTVKRSIYAPYFLELRSVQKWLEEKFGHRSSLATRRHKDAHPLKDPLLLLSRVRRSQWLISFKGRTL